MDCNRLKLLALTGGKNVPSARYRVRQLIPVLQNYRIDTREFIPYISKYPPRQYWLRPLWALGALSTRVPGVLATHFYDVALLQRELISTLFTLEPLIKHPLVLDVDDAIFLHRGGQYAKKLAHQCDLVICGNDYLANIFAQWNKKVVIIPTAVDTARFIPVSNKESKRNIIGWIGTSSNFRYLYQVEKPLNEVFKIYSDAYLRVISDSEPKFRLLSKEKVEFIKWSPKIEVSGIQEMTIGIMPLEDSLWAKGKCSFKMLLYMACGVPVVVSPVGMNAQVLSMGEVGLGASKQEEWIESLLELLSNTKKRVYMGKSGRKIIEKYFSINRISSILAYYLWKLVK